MKEYTLCKGTSALFISDTTQRISIKLGSLLGGALIFVGWISLAPYRTVQSM